jgi:hypothetical protein
MNILESRLGGFDLSIIDEEKERGLSDYQGPVNLILPNIDFDFTFELSRPLQSFGILKMFNDGFQRKGVNFTNILHIPFFYESASRRFSLITVWLCNFWAKEYRCKSCSPLGAVFFARRSQECKRDSHWCHLRFWYLSEKKAACKMYVGEIEPRLRRKPHYT